MPTQVSKQHISFSTNFPIKMVSGQDNGGSDASANHVARKQTSTERRIQNRKAQKAYREFHKWS
jgi:hypothetical protein